MKSFKLKSPEKDLISQLSIAENFWDRFMGLMGRKSLSKDQGILFPRCNSIHTFFMRFPIDVVFLNKHFIVTEVVEACAPWRLLLPRLKANCVIELAPYQAKNLDLKEGMILSWEEKAS